MYSCSVCSVADNPPPGQIALTNSNATKTVTRQNRDGTWSYVIPRSFRGGTIVGGTKEANDWRTDADPATRKRILDGAASILPHAKEPTAEDRELRVIADIVGRRPTRLGGPRVEFVEENSPGPNGAARRSCFIHAYGVGGRGYELSWGIADEVSQLAHQAVSNLDLGAGRRQKL